MCLLCDFLYPKKIQIDFDAKENFFSSDKPNVRHVQLDKLLNFLGKVELAPLNVGDYFHRRLFELGLRQPEEGISLIEETAVDRLGIFQLKPPLYCRLYAEEFFRIWQPP